MEDIGMQIGGVKKPDRWSCVDQLMKMSSLGSPFSKDHRSHGIGKLMIDQAMEAERLKSINVQTDDDAVSSCCKCGFSEESYRIP